MRRAATPVVLAALLLAASAALAHGGFEHFVGAIATIDERKVELRTDSAIVAFKLETDTRYLRRGQSVARQDVVAGSRVVIDARRENGAWVAKEVRFVVEVD
jgi:hypothetical protein